MGASPQDKMQLIGMASVLIGLMRLKMEVFQMFLTNSLLNPRFSTRNMTSHVNDGNEISIGSHVRSHSKALNIKYISLPCERKNNISCAHTREIFLNLPF